MHTMGSLRCEVCLEEDGEVCASPLLPPLLHKHLGVLVSEEVMTCEGCSLLLQNWDDFSTQAKINLAKTHPNSLQTGKQDAENNNCPNSAQEKLELQEVTLDLDLEVDGSSQEDSRAPTPNLEYLSSDSDVEMCEPDEIQVFSIQLPEVLELCSSPLPDFSEGEVTCVGTYSRVQSAVVWDMPIAEERFSEPAFDPLGVKQEPSDSCADGVKDEETPPCPEHDCPHCTRSFLYKQALNLHLKGRHKSPKQSVLKCKFCLVKFDSNAALYTHVLDHKKQIEIEEAETAIKNKTSGFCCHICNTEFPTEDLLKVHISDDHSRLRKKRLKNGLQDPKLKISPKKDSKLKVRPNKNSKLKVSPKKDPKLQVSPKKESDLVLQCPFCFMKWPSLSFLKDHIWCSHPESSDKASTRSCKFKQKNVVCDFCKKNLCSKNMLKYHIRSLHLGCHDQKREENLKSQSTVQVFTNKKSKRNPPISSVKLAVGASVACKCSTCGKLFPSSHYLQRHQRLRHSRNTRQPGSAVFKCDICSTTFTSPEILDCHYQVDHRGHQKVKKSLVREESASQETISTNVSSNKIELKKNKSESVNISNKKQLLYSGGPNQESEKNDKKQEVVEDKNKALQQSPVDLKYTKRGGMYFCNFCMKSYNCTISMAYHIREIHVSNYQILKTNKKSNATTKSSNIRKFSCGFCNERFTTERLCTLHSKIHMAEGPRRFSQTKITLPPRGIKRNLSQLEETLTINNKILISSTESLTDKKPLVGKDLKIILNHIDTSCYENVVVPSVKQSFKDEEKVVVKMEERQQPNNFTCLFCKKQLLSKLAMEYHVKQSHILMGHHLSSSRLLNKMEIAQMVALE